MSQFKTETNKVESMLLVLLPVEAFAQINSKLDLILEFEKKTDPRLQDWIVENEAQKLLGKKNTSLWSLRKSGKIIFSKVGGKTFYKLKSILDLLESGSKFT